jgi:hypothetical protein
MCEPLPSGYKQYICKQAEIFSKKKTKRITLEDLKNPDTREMVMNKISREQTKAPFFENLKHEAIEGV